MSRVQGGWSKPTNQSRAGGLPRPKPSAAQVKVQYDPATPAPRVKPADWVIKQAGEYELSTGPNGVSKINYRTDFLDVSEADAAFALLESELPWKQNSDKYGPQPRLTVWYGEHPYSYSGLTHTAHNEWHDCLSSIRERLEAVTGHSYNSVLCNLYRDNHESVDWHADDEPALHKNPFIASVSLGAMRVFEMRKQPLPEDAGNYEYVQLVKIPLEHGSLLTMDGATQEDWQHRLPKEYHDRGPRINLTFRTIFPS